jgi:hypothetical protein
MRRLALFVAVLFGAVFPGCGTSSPSAPAWPTVTASPAGITPTAFGTFSILTSAHLPVRKNVKNKVNISMPYMGSDGHTERTIIDAKQGVTFLVIVFPATTAKFTYKQTDFLLTISGMTTPQKPSLFTVGYGSAPNSYEFCTAEDAFYAFYNDMPIVVPPGTSCRLAVAFEVPAGSGSGTLSVQTIANQVSW